MLLQGVSTAGSGPQYGPPSPTLSSILHSEGPSVSETPAQQALSRLLQQWPFRALSLGAQLGGTVCP